MDGTVIDELRTISRSGKQVIAEMEEGERARTGISSSLESNANAASSSSMVRQA